MGRRKNYFFTDFRYKSIAKHLEKSKTRIPFEFIELDRDYQKKLTKICSRSQVIEFESKHVTVDALKGWKKSFKGKKMQPMKKLIEKMRLIKDKEEIKLMKKSQKINEQTFLAVRKLIKPGMTEQEIAWKIQSIGHDLGAEEISFPPIVAFGPNSAIPHHQNTTRKLKKSDIVLIDMGMKYKGYCSDMTRTFFMNKPTAEQAKVYQLVLDAQLAAIAAVKPGAKVAKLDQIARDTMGEYAEYFGHSLGHGIGLDVHEAPGVSTRSKETLKEGMVVTMEPGIYLDGKFGVRIEDMGRVGKKGYENFTSLDK